MCCDGAGWFAHFLEQKCERGANQTDQYAETKSVDVAEQRALLLKNAVENGGRFLDRIPVAGRVRERALDVRHLLLKIKVELRHVLREDRLADLRVTRDQRRDHRNANASTDIAHQI